MRNRRGVLLCLAAALIPATAVIAEEIVPDTNALAYERGRAINERDQAAWVSTDAMLAALDPATAGVRGWVIEESGNDLIVTYYGLAHGIRYAIFVAAVRDSEVISGRVAQADENRNLSAEANTLADALDVAVAKVSEDQPMFCTAAPPNHVVLPPESPGDPVLVYFLTPQIEDRVYPMGGHHRYDVLDGEVIASRSFTNSCLNMAQPRDAAFMFVTHLLDPSPTEIHYYLSFWTGLPLMVGTNENGAVTIWSVEGTRRP